MMLRKVYNDPPNGERVHARRYVDRDPSRYVECLRLYTTEIYYR
jgi:hypothetical protein